MEQNFDPQSGMGRQTVDLDQRRREQEDGSVLEAMRRADYRSSMTIVGEDLIREIQKSVEKGDIERLERSIKKALPITEGLEHGIYAESYGFPPRIDGLSAVEAQDRANKTSARLRNKFVNVEDSIDRANTGYLRDAITDATTRPLRELEYWDHNQEEWIRDLREEALEMYQNISDSSSKPISDEEITARANQLIERRLAEQTKKIENIRANKERLLELELHVKARSTIDAAFRQRQYVAYDKSLQGNMKQSIGLGVTEPDTPHLEGFYQVDIEGKGVEGTIVSVWGGAVDKAEREMVRLGEEGYFTGNLSTKQFNEWLTRILEVSKIDDKTRMDVVWAAWRMFCIKEMPGKYAMSVDESGKISFNANPPYVGDLSTWLSHPEQHRAMEYGWNTKTLEKNTKEYNWDGKPVDGRTKSYKAISHSGPAITIGRLTTMSGDPLTGAIAAWGKANGIPTNRLGNFMEFTEVRGGRYKKNPKSLWDVWQGENLSQADINFPWVDTELSGSEGSTESGSGAFGYWFLQRGRGEGLLKNDIQGVPKLGALDSIENVTSSRIWDKLGMIRPGQLVGGAPDNPYAYKVLGDLSFYTKNINDVLVTSSTRKERVTSDTPGHDGRGVSCNDYLANCLRVGLISEPELKWIKGKLGL